MRRKIRLYIGDSEVDLSTDSLVLMNYKADDLNTPAIVKNSDSQQVTLPSTRNNDAIFGMIFRATAEPRREAEAPARHSARWSALRFRYTARPGDCLNPAT